MADLDSDFIRDAMDDQAEDADCPDCGHSAAFLGYMGNIG